MSKKKKPLYKRKFKGVRYIANALVKYYKKRYLNYTNALPRAREILTLLNESGKSVKLDNIFALETRKRVVKGKAPELDKELLYARPYFDFTDYPIYILRSEKGIVFESNLIPAGLPELRSGEEVDYYKYFGPFVNYINKMASLTDPADNRYETDWLIVCTQPVKDSKGRWVSKIISLDNLGDEIDYGFNPNDVVSGPDKLIVKGQLPGGEGAGVPSGEEGKLPSGEVKKEGIDKQIELEKERQKTIELESKTMKEKMDYFRELKEAGMSIEDIKKFLGL